MDERRLARRTERMAPFRAMEVFERAWALEAQGRSIIHLEVGEPDFGTPAPVVDAATRAIAGGSVGYTPAFGLPELRQAISAYYSERFGLDVPAERIAVTTGASGALVLALAATVGPGDEVLLADPAYPCNRNLIRLCEAVPRSVPVGSGTAYQLTAPLVDGQWTESTAGVLLATPSNPTGTMVPPDELAAIVSSVTGRGGTCIVDEIYGELVYDRPPSTALALPAADDLFVVNSFSKTFGMTGWRIGWLVMPEWAIPAVAVLAQNTYICPPAPAQWGAVAALTPEVWDTVDERRKEFVTRRDLIVEGLRDIGFGVPVVPGGAFYVYAEIDRFGTDSSAFVARLLDETGVAFTPGIDFGLAEGHRHVRFAYVASLPRIAESLERLASALS